MAYQDDWPDRDRDWRWQRGRQQHPDEGSEYRRPSTGGLVPGNAGSGPFGGYGPAGYAPRSHTEFHGGEYLTGGMPGQFAGTFPAGGDFLGAGGMVISGIGSGSTMPAREGYGHSYGPRRDHGEFSGRGPRGYRRSDERITEDINERLTWHSQINAEDVEVKVEQGEVTLTGTVDSRFAKRLAEDIAESCSGVVDVHNRLKVDREAGRNASADREVSRGVVRDHTDESDESERTSTNRPGGSRARRR